MKRIVLAAAVLLPLVFLSVHCSGDVLNTTDQAVSDDDEETGLNLDCTNINADVVALKTILEAIENESEVTSVNGNGTIFFTTGEYALPVVRNSYDFAYVNPLVGYSGDCWAIDNEKVSAAKISGGLSFKAESDFWYARYNNKWNVLYAISEGPSIPVFSSVTTTEGEGVEIVLGDNTRLSLPWYEGEESLTLSDYALSFSLDAATKTISVVTESDWTATLTSNTADSDEWVSLSSTSGSGNAEVSVSVLANEDKARTAVWTFSAGGISAKLTVTQTGVSGTIAGGVITSDDVDPNDADIVSNTVFDRTVNVVFSSAGATVEGADATGGEVVATVSGNDVTIVNSGTETVIYHLTGTTTDGFLRLEGERKQAIVLDGVSITNPDGAAINNQNKKRTFVVVTGSSSLTDGSVNSSGDYPDQSNYDSTEDMKGCFFSEAQLVFSGSGTLKVTANGKNGICSDDYIRFMSNPTIIVTTSSSAGNGVRGKDAVTIDNGTLSITSNAAMKKGINSDGTVTVTVGKTTIIVNGGVAKDPDDNNEYKGSAGIKADDAFIMSGGVVTITNNGAGGKGVRAGDYDESETDHTLPDSKISGGTLTITTSGARSNDVSAKGLKIGYKQASGRSYIYGGNLVISGGTVVVKCTGSKSGEKGNEAIEAKGTLTISGGSVYASSTSDDAINSTGDMVVTGGYVYAYCSGNDAMDANGDMKLSGGVVYAVCTAGNPEVALDANTEGGKALYINSGATVIAYGGLERGASISQTCYSISASANQVCSLSSSSKSLIVFKAPSFSSSLVVTAPSLSVAAGGVSVSGGTSVCEGMITVPGTVSGGSTISLDDYSGNTGGFGPGGGPGGHPGGGGFGPGGHQL